MTTQSHLQRGISLIEALVAMAIMAFGMLGVLGMQATLRGNGDISKQRSEAARIAQAQMESRRAFSVIGSVGGAVRAYDDIANVAAVTLAPADTNTTFNRVETVTAFPASAASAPANYLARRKTLTIDVTWRDRNNVDQTLRTSSMISASAPEISAALATPATGSLVQNPGGRNMAIPRGAVQIVGTSTSRFTPPNAGGVSWVFLNGTGFIQQVCTGGGAPVCTNFAGRLLSGYVRFSTDATQPTSAQSRDPASPAVAGTRVEVTLTAPTTSVLACYLDTSNSSYVAYYCAVPVGAVPSTWWSGITTVEGLPLAADMADARASAYRVCRYTSVRSQADPLVTAPSDVLAAANANHPYRYLQVQASLFDQNFLVIPAGDGTLPFSCPDDTAAEPLGRTMDHQPRGP